MMEVKIANKHEKKMVGAWCDTLGDWFDGLNLSSSKDKRMVIVHDGNNYLGALMFCFDDEMDIVVNPKFIGRGVGLRVLRIGLSYLWRRVSKVKNREPCFIANCVNKHSAKLFEALGYQKDITGDYFISR